MIRIISGPKGTGKTKVMLEMLSKACDDAKGDIVFITDKRFNTVNINFKARLLYTEEFGVMELNSFIGFVKGLLAGNADIEYLFIDGLCKMTGYETENVAAFTDALIKLEREYGFKAFLTISMDNDKIPENTKRYIEN